MIVAVADFRVDLGLIEGPCHMPELVTQPWLEDELVVFAAPDNPLAHQPPTLEALANAPWILRERGSGTREVLDHLLLAHLPHFQLVMELGNSEAIKHAVRHGIGISCLSRRVVAEQLASGALVELPVPLRAAAHPVPDPPSAKAHFQRITAFSQLLRAVIGSASRPLLPRRPEKA